MNTLRSYFWWTHERGSLHYDIMVTLILLFLFVAPHYIDFKDKPVPTVALRSSEVLVKHATGTGMTFEVRASDLGNAFTDADLRAALRTVIEPIAGGPVTIDSYKAVTDTHGAIVAYDANVSR